MGAIEPLRQGTPGVWNQPSMRRGLRRLFLLIPMAVSLASLGCRSSTQGTDQLVPRSWKGNPWGPEANAARSRGQLPAVPDNPDMAAWAFWGRQNLRDGDILFRMGDARAAYGLFPFSRVFAAITDSRFSHCGIVAIEDGEAVVYDTSTVGPQRQPLGVWMIDAKGNLAVKRPQPKYQDAANRAVTYCRAVYQSQTPYDWGMKLGDDQLYCIEMTERAYAQAGLPLSNPVRIDHLPRYDEFPRTVKLIKRFSQMVPHQRAYVIGNETYGIWSSPALDLVYDATHPKPPGHFAPLEGAAEVIARTFNRPPRVEQNVPQLAGGTGGDASVTTR